MVADERRRRQPFNRVHLPRFQCRGRFLRGPGENFESLPFRTGATSANNSTIRSRHRPRIPVQFVQGHVDIAEVGIVPDARPPPVRLHAVERERKDVGVLGEHVPDRVEVGPVPTQRVELFIPVPYRQVPSGQKPVPQHFGERSEGGVGAQPATDLLGLPAVVRDVGVAEGFEQADALRAVVEVHDVDPGLALAGRRRVPDQLDEQQVSLDDRARVPGHCREIPEVVVGTDPPRSWSRPDERGRVAADPGEDVRSVAYVGIDHPARAGLAHGARLADRAVESA